jgi:hypothetical protein
MLIWYLCPVGFFLAIAIMLKIMGKNARFSIVSTILGIQCKSSSELKDETNNSKSDRQTEEDLEKYLYVDNTEKKYMKFSRRMRLISYFLTTAILTVFLTILFEGCVLSTKGIIVGTNCPDFDAHCFDTTDVFHTSGPFVCTPGEKANFNISVRYVWCVGWVIDRQEVNNVLEKIGTCGGLLGIISCVVPLVYYISYYESCPWKGWFWIWVPLSPFIALIVIGLYIRPSKPSMLTVISLSLVFFMALGGWIWAMFSAYKTKPKYGKYSCNRCCTFGYFSKCCRRQNIIKLDAF